MDLIFIALCIILVFIIFILYAINYIPYTNDIKRLVDEIIKIDPEIRNFTLGKTSANTFQNVVMSNEGVIQVITSEYPIKKDGTFYIIKPHGEILKYDDGFRIQGLDTIHFKCPDGYSGFTCQLDDICTANDEAGTLKPLTQTQFNALQLYRNDATAYNIKPIQRQQQKDDTQSQNHPRLRVQCLDNLGNFQLEACPDNSLLDNRLQCNVYDICQDSLNGYKHNYKINVDDNEHLAKDEYYICRNSHSVKMKCRDNTVFSSSLKSCITQSVCVGKGASATIPLNETSYIQCHNDLGIKVECPDGVVRNAETDTLSCRRILCKPKTWTYTDNLLKYDYGEVVCSSDGVAQTILCDPDKNPKSYTLEWAERTNYTIDTWPMEILRDGKCVQASHDDTTLFIDPDKPIVSLRYTNAMPDKHQFNLKTRQFECSDNASPYWNYDEQIDTNNPNDSQSIWYSGAPCQTEPITPYPFKFNVEKYPSDKIYIFVTEAVNIEPLKDADDIYYWPVQTAENEYQHTLFTQTDTHLVVDTYKSNAIPLGFKLPPPDSGSNKLELVGYPNAPNSMTAQYYFISSGKLETVQLHDRELVSHREFSYSDNTRTIDSRLATVGLGELNFAINMTKFKHKIHMLDMNVLKPKYLTIDPGTKTIKYGKYKYNLGYSVFTLSSLGTIATLKYSDIIFKFSTIKYPFIKF